MKALLTIIEKVPLMGSDKVAIATQTERERPANDDNASDRQSDDSGHQEDEDLVVLDAWW